MSNRDQEMMKRWIEDTQMFQRIAHVEVTSTAELERDWKRIRNMKSNTKKRLKRKMMRIIA